MSEEAAGPSFAAMSSGTLLDVRPRKKYFRSRAHCNPLSYNDSFNYPTTPSDLEWEKLYPELPADHQIPTVLDLGMGFGGLTVALAKEYPEETVLGIEIRAKVCEFVRLRIEALRLEKPEGWDYRNAACLRTNGMRYLPHYLPKGCLKKLFICFPDPHFKAKNHRRRIVSPSLLSEYAYFLRPEGRLYLITDVRELHDWHVNKVDGHPLFRRVPEEEARLDVSVELMSERTEESQKVSRCGGQKYWAVYQRVSDTSEVTRKPAVLALLADEGEETGHRVGEKREREEESVSL